MENLYIRLERNAQRFMAAVYALNIVYDLCTLLMSGDLAAWHYFIPGAALVTNALLILCFVTRAKLAYRKTLLMLFCAMQPFNIAMDFARGLSNSWGCVILKLLFLAAYLWRYFWLRSLSDALRDKEAVR